MNLCLSDLRAESRRGSAPLDENMAGDWGEDSFEVTVAWNGSETAFTLRKSDFAPGDAQHGEYHKLFGF